MQRLIKALLGIVALLCTAAVLGSTIAQVPAVGEVSLVLGKAFISQEGEKPALVRVGTQVHVNDVIETNGNGHVHIRFVDAALVTVRPSSTLEIIRYDYDPHAPQNSAVKLNLVEGVAHAISGDAAKSARQNFRLNTPIAAIGVRGTDFTVSATQDSVRAIVNEGAIVVAPFSSGCSAATLGPCNQDAIEVSGLSRQMLELSANAAGVSSVLLPISPMKTQVAMTEAVTTEKAEPTVPTKNGSSKELYADTVTSVAVNNRLAKAEFVKEPVIKTPEFTPATVQSAAQLTTNSQLVWGRWRETNLENERISVSAELVQNEKAVTVGGLGYFLFRAELNGPVIKPGLGVLAFNLSKAQVQYRSGGTAELMAVSGGTLMLDFDQAKFSTSLLLNHPAVGEYQFATSGGIYSGGYFHSNTDNQSMAGAVSVDGKEAGYFFERAINGGSIEGLTLWNKQP